MIRSSRYFSLFTGVPTILLLLTSCTPKKEAGVSRLTAQGKEKLPIELCLITGQRKGYTAHAEWKYAETGSQDTLAIQITLEPGVPTKFVRGTYTWKTFSGEVTCSSIDFFGGQGGRPSIGGNFSFSTTDGEKYVVFLPTTGLQNQR